MPLCLKCDNYFSAYVEIDGQLKSLQSRKYCLECSPYKTHKPRVLQNVSDIDGQRVVICARCGNISKCGNLCSSCRVTISRQLTKEFLIDYKGGKCEICGYNKCTRALQFHHKDPLIKRWTISQIGSGKKRSELIKEVDKCILLCANCHAEIHYIDCVDPDYWGVSKSHININEVNSYGELFYCTFCGVKVTKNSKVCVKCFGKNQYSGKIKISNEDLKKLIWEKPIRDVAKDFDVTDSAIHKHCKIHGIIKPPRGYWLKTGVVRV